MKSNVLPGGMYSNVQPGMLGLEMFLHPNIPQQNPSNPHHHHPLQHHHPMAGDYPPQTQQPSNQGYPFSAKSKIQTLTLSDDDEPVLQSESIGDDGQRKISLWQRMKWTGNMVRLLIWVVYSIGDEVVSDGNDLASKKKGGGGVLQKKGKWKSVSKAMMERGFYVSPQQCEDKFNDLNKRYKRVNDILGRGTACRIVETPSLLAAMDNLSPRMKEEVKKLLNSKHLFFREMCAYHNSCGHGAGASTFQHSPLETAAPEHHSQTHQQQSCFHSSENADVPAMSNLNMEENEGLKLAEGEDEDEVENEDEDEGDDEMMMNGRSSVLDHSNDADERPFRKRLRKGNCQSPMVQELDVEMKNMLQDGTKSLSKKMDWMKVKVMGLDEQRVCISWRTLEHEKQKLKWLKFSSKNEREMEREKLANERLKLENERMVLLIRQNEVDLLHHLRQHSHYSNKKSDPSCIPSLDDSGLQL